MARRRQASEEFRLFDSIQEGVTVQDPSGSLLYVNESAARAMGFGSSEEMMAAPLEDLMAGFRLFDEQGQPFPREALPGRLALQGERPPEIVVRWETLGEGEPRWSAIRSNPVFDERGRVSAAINVFRDITEQRRAEEEIQARVRQQAAVATLGHRALSDIGLTELMQEAAELLVETLGIEFSMVLERAPHGRGLVLRAGVGWKPDEIGVATVGVGSSSQPGYTMLTRTPVIVENLATEARFSGPPLLHEHGVVSGATVIIPGVSGPFGVLGVHSARRRKFTQDDLHFLDSIANVLATAIERKQAEEARARLLESEREAREGAEAARERLAFLSEAGGVLAAASLDYVKTLQRVAELVVPRIADWCTVDVIDERGDLEQVAIAHTDPEKVEWAKDFRRRFPPRRDQVSGPWHVLQTGEAELFPEIDDAFLRQRTEDPELLSALRAIAPRSAMIVPLAARGRTFGTVSFVSAESGRRYTEEDLEFADSLARRAAIALDNARLYRERSHVARTLQKSLLPQALPEVPGVELAARYRSAHEESDVGGDFYDVFESSKSSWTVVVGDVCGRGVEAASLTGMVRQTLRGVATRRRQPSRVLRDLNEAIIPQTTDMRFCTVVCARLDLDADSARFTSAAGGHPLPMLLRSDGTVETVGRPGTLLGLFPDVELYDASADMRPGDAVVMFTDGVSESFETQETAGEAPMASLLATCAGLEASEIAERVESAAVASQTEPSRDDMAVLVVRLAG
ncbi:MAG TPA: SpoIIE family protein phosphatase [Actinomycetota bacterium]|nr:SpoIIE family protein phosphatase [Actinomycetota bacterium]